MKVIQLCSYLTVTHHWNSHRDKILDHICYWIACLTTGPDALELVHRQLVSVALASFETGRDHS